MGVSDGQDCNAATLNAAFADIAFKTTASGSNFTLANNQSSPANVTGLLLDKTAYRSILIRWQVYRKSTGGGGVTRVQTGLALVWHDDTNWTWTEQGMSGVDAGVVLDVNASTGQVTYTSDNQAGTYNATTSVLTYEIQQTMRL